MTKQRDFFLFLCVALSMLITGCGRQHDADNAANNSGAVDCLLTDKPIESYRKELLHFAFETASLIPVKPHIKDRSRAQEKIVASLIELDQPLSALDFIEKIDNWRRGSCYADIAFYYARRGCEKEVQRYIDMADQISESVECWRRDHIRVKIANAYALIGEVQHAEQYQAGVEASEEKKVAGVMAMIADENDFKEQMEILDSLIATGNFDSVTNALKACANLFNRFYKNEELRLLAEEKIKSSWGILPVFMRIELLQELAGFALEHADQAKTLELVNEAQTLVDDSQWRPEHIIPIQSKISRLRYLAGDRQKAMENTDAMLALFHSQRDKIINIYRAGALRALAEAYMSMGDKEKALMVYKRAVEEGMENPNSRPRAEDLSAACLSMALNDAEPDDELWARIRRIKEGLGDPW